MRNAYLLMQAYSEAPWRRQAQFIGLFFLVLVSFAVLAGIYLTVTARAATFARAVQNSQYEIDELRRSIADLETQLAQLTSSAVQQERAEDLGLMPVTASEIVYVVVPGYTGRQPVHLAPPPNPVVASQPGIAPEFSQSLFDWLLDELQELDIPEVLADGGVQ